MEHNIGNLKHVAGALICLKYWLGNFAHPSPNFYRGRYRCNIWP